MAAKPLSSRTEGMGCVFGLAGAFLLLAILLSPWVLPLFITLDWKVGNIYSASLGLSALSGLAGGLVWLFRSRIARLLFRRIRSRKEALFSLVGLALSVMVAAGGAEIFLRVLGQPFKVDWAPHAARAQFDTQLGWSYIPGLSIDYQFVPGQTEIPVSVDPHGIRISHPGAGPDPTAPSLLLIGGSYTMGFGLPYEETFAGRLAGLPGFPFQVINLGVEGFGTDQSYLMLQRHIERFNTQVVVYTFIEEHIDRNSVNDRRIVRRTARYLGTKPQFAIDGGGGLYQVEAANRYEDLRYSRVQAVLEIFWYRWGPKPELDLTRALVREIKRTTETQGAEFVLVDWTMGERGIGYAGGTDSRGAPASIFSEEGYHLVDTGVDAPPGWYTWFIPNDTHPDARAHERVARLILEKLVELGLVDAGLGSAWN